MSLKDKYTIVYEGPRQPRPSSTAPATPKYGIAEDVSQLLIRNVQVALAGFTLGKAARTASPLPTSRHITRTLRHDFLPSDKTSSVVLDLANYKTSAFESRGAAHASQQLLVEGLKIGASSKTGASKLISLRSCQRLAGAIIGGTLSATKNKAFKANKADLTNAFAQCVRVSPKQLGSGMTVAETFVPGGAAKILARRIAEASVGIGIRDQSIVKPRKWPLDVVIAKDKMLHTIY